MPPSPAVSDKSATRNYEDRQRRAFRRALIACLVMFACVALGCTSPSKATNANSASSNQKPGGNENASAVSRTASSQSANIDIKDPERYSLTMTFSIQDTASAAAAPAPPQQLTLAKLGADRRWTFVFPPPLGQIVYIEKSGLKYIVLFERKQYAELTPDAFGFQLGDVLTPHSIADRMKQGQPEELGLEPVNGRTAIKYRISAASAPTQPDGTIYVDQETRLPLRSELNRASSSGAKSRAIVEVRDVQLNPDRAQFDVPFGMKKTTQQEARQQVEGFRNALRAFVDNINGAPSALVAKPAQAPVNRNGSRKER